MNWLTEQFRRIRDKFFAPRPPEPVVRRRSADETLTHWRMHDGRRGCDVTKTGKARLDRDRDSEAPEQVTCDECQLALMLAGRLP